MLESAYRECLSRYPAIKSSTVVLEALRVRVRYVRTTTNALLPPLVLLHGAFASTPPFFPLIDRLKDTFHVFALEVPGWGLSDDVPIPSEWDARDCTARYVEILRLFLEQVVFLRPCRIIAHSFSAYVAVHFAHMYPEHVRSLTLLACTGIFPTLGTTGWYWATLFKFGLHKRVFVAARRVLLPLTMLLPRLLRFTVRLNCTPCTGMHVLPKYIRWGGLTRSYWRRPCILELSELRVPTSLVYGSLDTLTPAHQGRAVSKRSEGLVGCYVVEGAGHAPHAKLERFLTQFHKADARLDSVPCNSAALRSGAQRVMRRIDTEAKISSSFNTRRTDQVIHALYRDFFLC